MPASGILVAGTTAARCLSSAAGMLRFLARLSGRRRHVRRSCAVRPGDDVQKNRPASSSSAATAAAALPDTGIPETTSQQKSQVLAGKDLDPSRQKSPYDLEQKNYCHYRYYNHHRLEENAETENCEQRNEKCPEEDHLLEDRLRPYRYHCQSHPEHEDQGSGCSYRRRHRQHREDSFVRAGETEQQSTTTTTTTTTTIGGKSSSYERQRTTTSIDRNPLVQTVSMENNTIRKRRNSRDDKSCKSTSTGSCTRLGDNCSRSNDNCSTRSHSTSSSSWSNFASNTVTAMTSRCRIPPYLATLLLISYTLFGIADACSSRSTPKPRPPPPTPRPNITFHMYTCPPDYAEWYCLNGATCFTVKIVDSLLYNCLCANGYIGQRCEFKDLDGSYLPSRQRVMLETASIAGGATIAVFLVVIICIAAYIHCKRKQKELRTSSNCVDTVDGPGRDPELRPFSNRSRSLMIFMAKNPSMTTSPSIEQTRMPAWNYPTNESARMASVNEGKRSNQ